MSYFLYILLFGLIYYVFFKILGSLIKGCITVVFIIVIAFVAITMIKSTKQPVNILDIYQVDNFKIRKL